MSDDKELLERAAKAAGIDLTWCFMGGKWICHHAGQPHWHAWNPLTDDGDALRLAVKLGIRVWSHAVNGMPSAALPGGGWMDEDSNTADPYAATRRAITRAAAKVGDGKDVTL